MFICRKTVVVVMRRDIGVWGCGSGEIPWMIMPSIQFSVYLSVDGDSSLTW